MGKGSVYQTFPPCEPFVTAILGICPNEITKHATEKLSNVDACNIANIVTPKEVGKLLQWLHVTKRAFVTIKSGYYMDNRGTK